MIPINIDLWVEAEELIPAQFYDKTTIKEVIKQPLLELQKSNDQIFDILDNLNVFNATGYLLDCVGSYVAVLRMGEEDEPFRDRIKRQILTGSSEGTPNELLELLKTITGNASGIWEHYPVSCTFATEGLVIPSNLTTYMQEASPASSGNVVIYLNPFKHCLIPAELSFNVLKLANQNLNPFITNNNEFITVNNLIYGADQADLALLSEFTYGQGASTASPDGLGILCEIAYFSGGVKRFNQNYAVTDSIINDWFLQMNYITPPQFIKEEGNGYLPGSNFWDDNLLWEESKYWGDSSSWDDNEEYDEDFEWRD